MNSKSKIRQQFININEEFKIIKNQLNNLEDYFKLLEKKDIDQDFKNRTEIQFAIIENWVKDLDKKVADCIFRINVLISQKEK